MSKKHYFFLMSKINSDFSFHSINKQSFATKIPLNLISFDYSVKYKAGTRIFIYTIATLYAFTLILVTLPVPVLTNSLEGRKAKALPLSRYKDFWNNSTRSFRMYCKQKDTKLRFPLCLINRFYLSIHSIVCCFHTLVHPRKTGSFWSVFSTLKRWCI